MSAEEAQKYGIIDEVLHEEEGKKPDNQEEKKQ
jgi:ATP-dependent protease ClpP protease subunit